MAGYSRKERVAELLRTEIATMLVAGEIKDARIGLVTVTKVRLSPDLKHATVFFSHMGTEADRDESLSGLKSACGFIRRTLARRLDLRVVPTIEFSYDDSIEYASRIEKILREIQG